MSVKRIFRYEILTGALHKVKKQSLTGFYMGGSSDSYFYSCGWFIEEYQCSIIFTRDVGHHACGWWKNPEYERCYHLSIRFLGERNKTAIEKIITGLFGSDKNKIWIEPPYSKEGKQNEIWHYRLFCDANWQPIIPRGEVYTTEFTEKGWKSYSELNDGKKM